MKYEVRTIINGRRLCVKVDYKRYIKRIMEEWGQMGATYVDVRPITDEQKEERAVVKTPPAKVINWDKVKSFLQKTGT